MEAAGGVTPTNVFISLDWTCFPSFCNEIPQQEKGIQKKQDLSNLENNSEFLDFGQGKADIMELWKRI